MSFEKNRNPNYYKDNSFYTNCGSFAFNICDWYGPDDRFDEDDYELALKLSDEYNLSDSDILDILFDRDVEQICKDFDVVVVDKDYEPKENENLVAFRICVNRSFYDDELIVDYHFRAKKGDTWFEKCGIGSVREVKNYSEDSWIISDDLIYWGPIAYFAVPVN